LLPGEGRKGNPEAGTVVIPFAVRTNSRYLGGVNRCGFITAPTLALGVAAVGCVTKAPTVKAGGKISRAQWSYDRALPGGQMKHLDAVYHGWLEVEYGREHRPEPEGVNRPMALPQRFLTHGA